MAGRGQIPNPALRRYDAVPCIGAVYLVELGEHTVKVGCSARSVPSRLRELHTYLVRQGYEPGRFAVFPTPDARGELGPETDAIHALQKVAAPLPGKREYFSGISFQDAVRVVGEALKD